MQCGDDAIVRGQNITVAVTPGAEDKIVGRRSCVARYQQVRLVWRMNTRRGGKEKQKIFTNTVQQ